MAKLNAAQHAAVEHDTGPLLVLAGAGSGKTRVITHRIARLLEKGVRPEAILAVSFTNKAAEEMAERMTALVGRTAAAALWLSTFHSFGLRFLGEEPKAAFGHDGRFVIYDQGDTLGLVKEMLRRRGGDQRLDPMAVLARISLYKNAFLTPEEVAESDFPYDEAARELYPEYEATLRAMRAVDFDDLVVLPVRVLARSQRIREKWRNRFRYLLIDEFQDTNRSQLELVRHLANDMRNVCVVGDDDQSIYGWRGADVGNILDFESHFPGAMVVKLEDNYRSKAPILAVANRAIALSTRKRHEKTLRAARGPGDPVRVSVADDPVLEAKLVTREIEDLVKREGRRFGDVAVLYRGNLQARVLEDELRIFDIPYRLFGGTQFFDRKEVKDAAAYLRVLVSPYDELSMRRVLSYPPRGVGSTSIERISAHAAAKSIPFTRALAGIEDVEGVPPNAARAVAALRELLDRAGARLKGGEAMSAIAGSLFVDAGIRTDLLSEPGPRGARRWENVVHLVKSIARFEQSEHKKSGLAAFLQRIALKNEPDAGAEETGNRVTLSTLHAAKGLEFPVVFLIGCVEGQLPHSRTTDPKITEAAPTDVDEERRLFYVGVTRAKDRLYLTRPRMRPMRGKAQLLTPSRFLDGLPDEALTPYERSDEKPPPVAEAADFAESIIAQLRGAGAGPKP